MHTMYNPILLYVTVAGILLILLVTAFSMVVELRGKRRIRKLRKNLEDERVMSEIAISETENIYITETQEFVRIINSIIPEQQDAKERILSYLEEAGSHNHVEEVKCRAHQGDPAKWWQIRYLVIRDEYSFKAAAVLINIDKEKQFDKEISDLEVMLDKRVVTNEMYKTLSTIIDIPINAIVNACNKIVQAGNDIEPSFKETQIGIANANLQNLTKTIQDFRNYVAIDTNAVNISPKNISVKEYLESIFKEYKAYVEEDGSGFYLVNGREDVTINVDENALHLVLMQLIDNAKKFTDHGNIAIGWKARFNPASVEIFVEDSGIGINKEDMDKVFVPGWTKSIYTLGNGIGLSIAKTFTEAMEGTIKCESQLGIGSRFYVTFKTIE